MAPDDKLSVDRRTLLKTTGAASAAISVSGLTTATPGRTPGPKEDEVLVGVSAGNDLVETVRPGVPGDAEIVHKNDTLRYVAVKFPEAGSQAMDNFIAGIQQRDGVKYAEVNTTHEAFFTPNDPRYGDQCMPQTINADTAWDTTLGDSGVTLSVVDTGVQYDHEDLSGNYRSNPGYDFVDSDSDPYPDDTSSEYHGTHVSGIAGAVTDNGTGIAGVSDSTLINGRALDESGRGSTSDIADAVEWSADEGADAVNLSLGGGGYTSTMKNAVGYAVNNGCLPIAAAGNDGSYGISYPAKYDECLAVSAIDCNENFSSFSQYGPNVDVTAPGVDVLSTTTDARGSYERLSGTSMATPVVTGVAGLIEARWGDLSPNQLRNHITGTAVDVGLSSDEQGCGRVDADNAVTTDPANRSSDCGAGGGGGGGSCGDTSTSGSVDSSLDGYWDSECWTWAWEYTDPCEVVVDLDGPSDADFDLYVNDGRAQCPTTSDYDYRSISTDSQETVTISNPDTSTDLYVLVDSYSGSGSYTLSITEKTD
jgi:serine protease